MELSPREKRWIGAGAALAAMVALYHYVHEPLMARWAEAAEAARSTREELAQATVRLRREGDLSQRRAMVEAREQALQALVPGKNAAALLIWHLSQAEIQSGTRIRALTVTERKVVRLEQEVLSQGSAISGATGPSLPTGGTAESPGGESGASGKGAGESQWGGEDGDGMHTLTVLRLELKADGRFAEHLLFAQALERIPLFLNAQSFGIERDDKATLERAEKLIQGGNPLLAVQLLRTSPVLSGVYQLNLYFQGSRVSLPVEMPFDQPAGRTDPFVMDGVDEFIRALTDHYASAPDQPLGPSPDLDEPSPEVPAAAPADGSQMG